MNRSIGQILQAIISPDQLNWYQKIPMVKFAINSSISKSTGFAPFELVVTRCAGPDHTSDAQCVSAPLLTVCIQLPSESLGTALHNLSRDSGDFFTTLSILLYLLYYPTACSDYYRMYTSWPCIYFHNSSGSSINSSTIVGSTQTKNLVVFQFRLCANPLLIPL